MESLATELKKAREQKGISLRDIADSTLINIRFLEEIDAGNFAFLPQTYVRAFLREYAAAVGLSPDDVIRAYDAHASPGAPEEAAPAAPPDEAPPPLPSPIRKEGTQISPTMALIALVVTVVLALTVALWNILAPEPAPPVREIPFDDVRREADTMRSAADSLPTPVSRDSLVLVALASDSVWMQVAVDSAAPKDAFLRKDQRRTWTAAARFVITLGNAGAVEFTLNGRPLGALGRPGTVLRDHALTRAALKGRTP